MRRVFAADRVPQIFYLLVTTAAGFWAHGRWLDPIGDPGFAWSLAYRLGQGEQLYRDIYFAYGPLSPYLLAAAGRPFDYSALWYLLANWIPAVAAGWLLLECARRYTSVLEGLALATLLLGVSILAPGPGRLVLPYYPGVVHAVAFSLGALLLVPTTRTRLGARGLAAGALAGLALCCKPEAGLAALAALLAAAAAGIPRPLAWAARVVAGFSLVAAAGFFFAISCDSLASLQSNSHLWPLNPSPPPELGRLFRIAAGMTDPQWPLVVRSAAFRLLFWIGLIALAAMGIARERSRRRWLTLAALFGALGVWFAIEGVELLHPSNVLCLWMLAAFLVAALAVFRPSMAGRPFFVAVGILAGLLGSRAAFSCDLSGPYTGAARLAGALTWVLLLCVFVPTLLLGSGPAALWARRILAATILASALPHAWNGIQAMQFPSRLPVETLRGRVFLDGPEARFFGALRTELRPGERVLVLPEISAVDALFEVRQASPFLNHLPGWLDVEVERRLIFRLEGALPDAVVIFQRPTGEYGLKPFGVGFGVLLSEWCLRRYEVVVETPTGAILRPRKPTGTSAR